MTVKVTTSGQGSLLAPCRRHRDDVSCAALTLRCFVITCVGLVAFLVAPRVGAGQTVCCCEGLHDPSSGPVCYIGSCNNAPGPCSNGADVPNGVCPHPGTPGPDVGACGAAVPVICCCEGLHDPSSGPVCYNSACDMAPGPCSNGVDVRGGVCPHPGTPGPPGVGCAAGVPTVTPTNTPTQTVTAGVATPTPSRTVTPGIATPTLTRTETPTPPQLFLTRNIGPSDTTIPVNDITQLPDHGTIEIDRERMTFTGKRTTAAASAFGAAAAPQPGELLNVQRGVGSTTPAPHQSGAAVLVIPPQPSGFEDEDGCQLGARSSRGAVRIVVIAAMGLLAVRRKLISK